MARIAILFFVLCGAAAWADEPFDLVVAGGTVLDGTGAPGRRADIGIRAGRITAIGNLANATARRRISADGLIVAPGFIDIHNHSDYTLLAEPRCESMVRQGVTTMVLGEGESAGPAKPGAHPWTTLDGYFTYVEERKVATNICSYVGEGQIWRYVKGDKQTPASEPELRQMRELVVQAMEQGAMGLSSSLLMPPANLITTDQLISLAEVAQRYGGIYSTHIRDEGEGVFRSVEEAIAIGKGARIRVDIIHLKIAHKNLWGRMGEVIALINRARAEGYDIQANVYPYTAGQNNLAAIIPPWAHDGGREAMLGRLRNPADRERMRRDILNGIPGWYDHYLATGGGWDGIFPVSFSQPRNKPFTGKSMSELIRARGGDPVAVLLDVLFEEGGSVPAVYFHHSEADMQLALKQPFTSVGSDGAAISPEGPGGSSKPHPRWYGTFPRILGRYVRELQVLSLPEAVKKMTSMNAEKVGIRDRGRLQAGAWADVTIFDAKTVADRATFAEPHRYPEGIRYVIVNGELVLDGVTHTGALPGRVIRGPGYKHGDKRPGARPTASGRALVRGTGQRNGRFKTSAAASRRRPSQAM